MSSLVRSKAVTTSGSLVFKHWYNADTMCGQLSLNLNLAWKKAIQKAFDKIFEMTQRYSTHTQKIVIVHARTPGTCPALLYKALTASIRQ
jgi:hypothetical protein